MIWTALVKRACRDIGGRSCRSQSFCVTRQGERQPVMDSLREGAADLAPSDDAPREGWREGGVPRTADSPWSEPLLEARLTPLTSASERSSSEDSSLEGSTLVGPPREYTPVYVDCSHQDPHSMITLDRTVNLVVSLSSGCKSVQ